MSYRITIGVTEAGTPLFGADTCRAHGAVMTTKVYGSQLAHRVTVRLPDGGVDIVTPTEADKRGLAVLGSFYAPPGARGRSR